MRAGKTALARGLRRFCFQTFGEFENMLDRDFPSRFRVDTPERFSELFYAASFKKAGWTPIPRVLHFDLAFSRPNGGRLLVEVVTPAPPPRDSWSEELFHGHLIKSADNRSLEAAYLRLTSAFSKKAEIIARAMAKNITTQSDYKVIAISGVRIRQETPIALHSSGMPPNFARAFLPIGPLTVPLSLEPRSGEVRWGSAYHTFSDRIPKSADRSVHRTALLSDEFGFVDAVAYTEAEADGLDEPHFQVGVLHNPTTRPTDAFQIFGMGNEYSGVVDGDQLHLSRHRLPEVASIEDLSTKFAIEPHEVSDS